MFLSQKHLLDTTGESEKWLGQLNRTTKFKPLKIGSPKNSNLLKTHSQAVQDIDEFVSSEEQI